MSNTHTCQRGGRTFAAAAGGPGSAQGPDQSAQVNQRQPNRDSQSQSSVVSLRSSIAGRATGVLGERRYWRSNNSDIGSAQTSQPFSRVQPPTRAPWRKTVKKTLDFHYDMVSGQSRKFSPLEADDSLMFTSEALQQQKQPHGVFQEEHLKCAFSDTNYGTCGG